MNSRRRCEWREGELFRLDEKAEQCGVGKEELREAILILRAALGEHSRLPSGVRVDTPRPDVKGEKAFGGFWVGVFEIGDFEIVIRPRVEKYGEMLARIRRALGDVSWIYLTASSIYAGDSRLAIYGEAYRLLGELWLLASREPRFLTERVVGRGSRIGLGATGPYLHGRRRVRNRALANAVVLGVRRVAEAVDEAYEIAKTLPTGVREVVEEYLSLISRGAEAVLEELGDMALWIDGEDLGGYWHVASRAVKGHSWGRLREAVGRYVMIPSTKLYELYVYVLFLENLGAPYRKCGDFCLEVENARLYFNKAPLSRLVKKLSGRSPKPDVTFKRGSSISIIEAKYRELNGRGLGLPDAVRIAAYLGDVARNGKLKAVVTALSTPQGIENPVRAKISNGVEAAVYYAVVNPDWDSSGEVRSALAFIMSDP
ncbi:hypothetical protein [Pyrobaculum aerophilum]|uniref:Uncharacterized protein n=1 Tax=Pyrobaculum aerophilum TaxID=13773 RepID=A0A832SZF1_9CREN|nr:MULTISPECIES: hypothetical protein [Pyrobaculum]MCX8136813.1 hypothetical protein [Pyrobaculum aerophilum]HII47777.1 hypothetical protein [Pyrobaculum aerophilum]